MYLHELGEEAASFTKEEMQQGKHQEYEQRLYEQYMNSQNLANTGPSGANQQQAAQRPQQSHTPPVVNNTHNSHSKNPPTTQQHHR